MSAEVLAAQHAALDILRQSPSLWPTLNRLTLGGSADWPYIVQVLSGAVVERDYLTLVRDWPEAAE